MSKLSHCRWGILGAAEIARKNWRAIQESGNGIVTAIASRDPARAERFLRGCQVQCPQSGADPAICGSYDELLARPDVDAVYIPLPTGLRPDVALAAARAGKHILSEKPCAARADLLRPLLDACRERRLQFMDGVMFMHSARLPALREVLDDEGRVGMLRRVSTQFSFQGGDAFLRENIRTDARLEPLGCLGDLGWYCLRFTLWALSGELPAKVCGRELRGQRNPGQDSVPLEFSGEMIFDSGASASFYCSFVTENQQWACLSGSRGAIQMRDFVLPFAGSQPSFDVINSRFVVEGCDFSMHPGIETHSVPEDSHGTRNSQEANMFRVFGERVLTAEIDEDWSEWAWRTQLVLDACLKSARSDSQWISLDS